MAKCLYKSADINKKAKKLATIFPFVGWSEIHELVPQTMEIVECIALIRDADVEDKKVTVIALVDRLLDQVDHVEGIRESVPGLFDVIDNASKGKYAINKEQYDEENV